MTSAPSVMVSSTFYDLRHVRAELARFISDDLGYIPLLSELPSFPIDPDRDTIENCRARVENHADILILVIGARYGSVDDKTDKSITNLEFLSARQKGIPIYAFVEKGILALIPAWKSNPSADFSAIVDTSRVFDFVEHVRSQERVWTFAFETPQDISRTLKRQLAYLFSECLGIRRRISGAGLPDYLASLGPQALRIALEKPLAWEYRLFFRSWIDQVDKRYDAIWEYESGLTLDTAEDVRRLNASGWLQTRLHELRSLVDSANKLMNTSIQEAFGRPGEPGDAKQIVWVSRMLGSVLDSLLVWARRIRCARLESPFAPVGTELSLFVDDLIKQFQSFPAESLNKLEQSVVLPESERPRALALTMALKLTNLPRFEAALAAAQVSAGLE